MASLQQRSTGKDGKYKYWYIVESRRVNGKPRPITLAYLGTADKLLKRLCEQNGIYSCKSYSHGAIACFLKLSEELNIVEIINSYTVAQKSYMAEKPLRHGLTSGITLLLGAIGRICKPTSKRGWWRWAQKTSCEYLLRMSLCKMNSQHFWDLMDCIPVKNIPLIEKEITQKIIEIFKIDTECLLYDTTNFYTYISSKNDRCTIAQRGKNKQKRNDLRQVGLAMVVTQKDSIPLFHETYQGNSNDTKVFSKVLLKIKKRISELGFNIENQTIVFDRGNNSIKNLAKLERHKYYYAGALTPSDHKKLIEEAENNFTEVTVNGIKYQAYKVKKNIWNYERTVVVYISENLKAGQLAGIYQSLEKKKKNLRKIQRQLLKPKTTQHDKEKLDKKVVQLLKGQFMKDLISHEIEKDEDDRLHLNWSTNKEKLGELEDDLGFRIVMTNRHEWSTEKIISTYHGQADIETAFKHLKNRNYHGGGSHFHWTDQKIKVDQFIAVLGYQLTALMHRELKEKIKFTGSQEKMLEILNNVRLAALLEESEKKKNPKVRYILESMETEEQEVVKALKIEETHIKRPKIKGIGVYNSKQSER